MTERIRPADLESPPLRVTMRGYDRDQVDELLNRARSEVATLIGELSAARSEIDRLRAQVEATRGREDGIKETLLIAQRAAEETRNSAQREAATIIGDARHRAEETVREYESRISDLRWELERLRIERQRYVKEFTQMLEGHLRSLAEESTMLNEVAVVEERHPAPEQPHPAEA